MATIQLPTDFREFLRLLNSHQVEYLIVGGYAVIVHGYPRATGGLDVWIATGPENAASVVGVLRQFGFSEGAINEQLFAKEGKTVTMGVSPLRIDILTRISGAEFADSYQRKLQTVVDGVNANIIALDDLKANKRAAGRAKDLADLENLP